MTDLNFLAILYLVLITNNIINGVIMLKKSTLLFVCAAILMMGTQEVSAGCPGGVCGLRAPQRTLRAGRVAAHVARKVSKKGKKRRGVLFPRRVSCSSCR